MGSRLVLWVTDCGSLGEAVLGAHEQAEKAGFQLLLPEPDHPCLSVQSSSLLLGLLTDNT